MTPERWQRICALFHEVQQCDPAGRETLLQHACGDDPDLRAEVERLLADDRAASRDGFLDVPTASFIPTGPILEQPGDRVGPYKILQALGEGGMGIVFLAEQDHPVRRRVALKLIKPGMDSAQVIARFAAERQALAMMDHPNIARVLDAGATDTGRPYFVMELVKGVPITDYCDRNKLTTRQRLELFIAVCRAIQHAHQKGIIHRDIKPSNVLVALVDGKPVAKVIDFGVAKAIDQRLTEQTIFTQVGAIVGTPEYMSPEQAGLSAHGYRHEERRVLARRAALRASDRLHAAGARAAARGGVCRGDTADPGGGAAEALDAALGLGRSAGLDRLGAGSRRRGWRGWCGASWTGSRCDAWRRTGRGGTRRPARWLGTSSGTWPGRRWRRARRRRGTS